MVDVLSLASFREVGCPFKVMVHMNFLYGTRSFGLYKHQGGEGKKMEHRVRGSNERLAVSGDMTHGKSHCTYRPYTTLHLSLFDDLDVL